MRLIKKIILFLLALIILLAAVSLVLLNRSLPPTRGEIVLKGIQQPVTIKRNNWGIPMIEAQSRQDLFYAIGFIHASDRLLQMDLNRRYATGRLSEIFGKRTLDTDRYHKDLMVEESVGKIMEDVSPDQSELLLHYCRGVNAFMETQPLPPEFTLLNYRPEPWKLEDIASIFKNMEFLLAGSGSELYNLKVLNVFGDERARKLTRGVHGSTIINSNEYEKMFHNRNLKTAFLQEINLTGNRIGSNSWVISGNKTDTGLPILANDLHLPNILPSYFYQILGRTGQDEWSGLTLPGVPNLITGRNAHLGWGFTNVGTDVIDYLILDINPDDPNQYRLDGEWLDFEIINKVIKVKGQKDVIHPVKLSRLGPVQIENGQVFARHSVMNYPATILEAFHRMNFSSTIHEFISALKKFSSPAQNVVVADRLGNIAYFPTGLVPKRKNGNGALPVPVSRSSDIWDGFYEEDKKPLLINPEKGYVVTANNPVIPENRLPLFAENWYPSFRADRIDYLLDRKAKLSLSDIQSIQTDSFLIGAEFLIKRIKHFSFTSEKARFVLEKLLAWNFKTESGLAPYLFYTFEKILSQNIFGDHIKDEELRKRLISYTWIYRILDYPRGQTQPDELSFWTDDIRTPAQENFRDMIARSLMETHDRYLEQSQQQNLSWKKLHTLSYQHPLGSIPVLKWLLNRGPYFMAGGRGCILTASFRQSREFAITHLSSYRMILDFNDFSSSVLINSSGQSGHFLSPHYDDQIELFVNLKYRKMENFSEKLKTLKLIPENH
jgi:penicillin amidase